MPLVSLVWVGGDGTGLREVRSQIGCELQPEMAFFYTSLRPLPSSTGTSTSIAAAGVDNFGDGGGSDGGGGGCGSGFDGG